MKAIRFKVSIPRYILGKALGPLFPAVYWSGWSCLNVEDVPEPVLPGPEWVKIRTQYGGICGTDMNTVTLHNSPYFEPFTSSPFTLGHENLGEIVETGAEVKKWQTGQRVIAEPLLWCGPRGLPQEEWCRYCARGEINRCEKRISGEMAPGIMIGFCRDTGGSWSRSFTAHQSQLYEVPDSVSDENALLVEPFACGLHAALQHLPGRGEQVLILGAGTIGLMVLAGLRSLDCKAHISISARYPFQVEAARQLGADEVISGGDIYEQVAELTGARLFKPLIGKRVMVGGMDQVFECVGADHTLDDALRFTRAGGKVVLVGVPGLAKGVDWSAIFDKELNVQATYTYHHAEEWQGKKRSTYAIALEMMASGKLDIGWMLNRRYRLDEYRRAFAEFTNKRQHPIIKSIFVFNSSDE